MILKYIGTGKEISINSKDLYELISVSFVKKLPEGVFFDIKFRIVNDNGLLALYNIDLFKVVDYNLDNDYTLKLYKNGNLQLIPNSMSHENFWDDFFNDEASAVNIFFNRFPHYKNKIF